MYSGYAPKNVALTSGMPYVLALKTLNHKIPKKKWPRNFSNSCNFNPFIVGFYTGYLFLKSELYIVKVSTSIPYVRLYVTDISFRSDQAYYNFTIDFKFSGFIPLAVWYLVKNDATL